MPATIPRIQTMGLMPFRGAAATGCMAGGAAPEAAPTWLPQLVQKVPVTGFPQLLQKAIATKSPHANCTPRCRAWQCFQDVERRLLTKDTVDQALLAAKARS